MERSAYEVIWTIDLDATNPLDAACQAWEMIRDPQSETSCFVVVETATGARHRVDVIEDR